MERADPGAIVRILWPHRFRVMSELDKMERGAKKLKDLMSSEAAAQMVSSK